MLILSDVYNRIYLPNIRMGTHWRKGPIAAITMLFGLLAGCAEDPVGPEFGQQGFVGGFFGGVAADEPHAVIAARDVLTAGGSAADAAITLAFSLSVTLPTRAGLGAGGSCVIHDSALGLAEVLDFVPRAGTGVGPLPMAVPTLARAMVVMHARYGVLDWRELVAPAENLARFGHRPSRALRRELEAVWPVIQNDPAALAVFGGDDGKPPTGETLLRQIQLASILAQIRLRGAGVLYTGSLSKAVANAYGRAGGTVTVNDIRDFVPSWRVPLTVPFAENRTLFAAPPPDNGGVALARIARLLEADDRFADAKNETRLHLLVESLRRAIDDRVAWSGKAGLAEDTLEELLSETSVRRLSADIDVERARPVAPVNDVPIASGGSTGFVVVDRTGMTVACGLTLGGPLGVGKMVEEYGFYPARAPGPGGTWLTPAIVASEVNALVYYAAAGTDGLSGLQAALSLLTNATFDDLGLEAAAAAPRFFTNPRNGDLIVEPGIESGDLARRGHVVKTGPGPARMNVVYCPSGFPVSEEKRRCAISTDPRGNGLSVLAE